MTNTMRAAVLASPGVIESREVSVPEPGPEDVLVRVAAVGVCGSDVHCYRHGNIGELVVESPIVLGHELSGTIVAVGSEIPTVRVGQRVAVEPGRPCLKCADCLRGFYNLCREMRFFAAPPTDGAFQELIAIPSIFAHEIPDEISMEAAALLEPVSCAIHSTSQARVTLGSRVLIAGAGPIGLLLVQLARARGANQIVVLDRHEDRLQTALRFGASRALHLTDVAPERLGRFDVFIDATGAESVVRLGLLALDRRGTAVLVGLADPEALIPVEHILNNEIVLTGSFRYRHTWPLAVELVASGAVNADALVTAKFGLDEVEEALSTTKAPGNIKTVVYPGVRQIKSDARVGEDV